ncbi:MAG TPA: hypothetical protein EYH12_01375 [Psychromonas hadalis]|nr:hypothetical protein [Psychromonas hadalis]
MLTYFANLSIRCKLFGLTLFPLLGFTCFSVYNFSENYQEKVVLEKMLVLTESESVSASLVHELQKERGASAGFLGSKGAKFGERLIKQRQSTNKYHADLDRFIANNELPVDLTHLFDGIYIELAKLN